MGELSKLSLLLFKTSDLVHHIVCGLLCQDDGKGHVIIVRQVSLIHWQIVSEHGAAIATQHLSNSKYSETHLDDLALHFLLKQGKERLLNTKLFLMVEDTVSSVQGVP